MAHDALASDLAETRRQCGEIVAERLSLGAWRGKGEADVLAMRPTWGRRLITLYEVKASRADLLADLRAGKWRRYLPWCERLVFALPAGMADKREIPSEAGVIVRGRNGWTTLRAVRPRQMEARLVETLLWGVLLKDHPATWKRLDRSARIRQLDAAGDDLRELLLAARRVSWRIESILEDHRRSARAVRELEAIEGLLRPWRWWGPAQERVQELMRLAGLAKQAQTEAREGKEAP